MRYVPILVLVACGSDIALMPEQEIKTVYITEPDPAPPAPSNATTVTGTAPETESLCGWWIPENGTFGDDVYVESKPMFQLAGGTNTTPITHWRGEDAEFEFLVGTSPCGNVELLNILIGVQDGDGNEWLRDVNDRGTAGTLESVYQNEDLEPVFADNMAVMPAGDELHYEWCSDELEDPSCAGNFTHEVNEGSMRLYKFEFTATNLVDEGEDYEIYVAYVMWRDIATGRVIMDYSAYNTLYRPVHCLP